MIFKYLMFSKFHQFFKNMIECHFLFLKKVLFLEIIAFSAEYSNIFNLIPFFCIYYILFVLFYGFISTYITTLDWFPRWLSGKE